MSTIAIQKPDADTLAAILTRCDPPFAIGGPGWGPLAIAALANLADAAEAGQVVVSVPPPARILRGDCPWTVEVDGEDLVVRNVTATCFGGRFDSGDDGQTESGYNNTGDGSKEANTFQVALPIRSSEAATKGSPLAFPGAHIPWLSTVMVWRESDGEETAVKALLTDNGPEVSKYPTHAADFNPPLALHFAPGFDPKKVANEWGESGMSYRIPGAAKYAA